MPADSAYIKVHADQFNDCLSSKEITNSYVSNVEATERCGQKLLADAQADISIDTRKQLIQTATAQNHHAVSIQGNWRLPLLNAIVKEDGEISKFQFQIPSYDNRVFATKVIDLK